MGSGGPGPVRRQIEHRQSSERPAPEGPQGLPLRSRQHILLPAHEVRVLPDGLLRSRHHESWVQHRREGPEVHHGVVRPHQQHPLAVRPQENPEAEQGAALQVERPPGLLLQAGTKRRRALVCGVHLDEIERGPLGDALDQTVASEVDRGAQRLMPVHLRLKEGADAFRGDAAGDPRNQRQVVGGAVRLQAVQEPEAPLAVRERQGFHGSVSDRIVARTFPTEECPEPPLGRRLPGISHPCDGIGGWHLPPAAPPPPGLRHVPF